MVRNSFLLELGIRSTKWEGKNKFQSLQQENLHWKKIYLGKNIQDVMIFLLENVVQVDCMIEFELESVAEEAPNDIKKLFMI